METTCTINTKISFEKVDDFGIKKMGKASIKEGDSKLKLDFKPIRHEDMPLIWEFLQLEKGRTTDFSYGGLFMWVDYFKYEYAVFKDTLFIKGLVENDRSKPAFSVPIGEMRLEESIPVLQDYCREHGIPLVLSAVPEESVDGLQAMGANYVELLTDWSDYLYDAEMLAGLHGKKMSKKRNHVNSFNIHNPEWKFESLTLENYNEVLAFMDKYDSELDDASMGKDESVLTRQMIPVVAKGEETMKGAVLYNAPGQICAFTIGDVKGDTLFIHIEKATREVNGSYEMINHLFAEKMMEMHPEIKYINREDDGGDEGLRKAKESYHPLALLRKYNVIF